MKFWAISGVYEQPYPDLFVDITKVYELINFTINNNVLILGANTTLTNTMEIFESLSKTTGFDYLSTIREHLDLVAHVAIRNVSNISQI